MAIGAGDIPRWDWWWLLYERSKFKQWTSYMDNMDVHDIRYNMCTLYYKYQIQAYTCAGGPTFPTVSLWFISYRGVSKYQAGKGEKPGQANTICRWKTHQVEASMDIKKCDNMLGSVLSLFPPSNGINNWSCFPCVDFWIDASHYFWSMTSWMKLIMSHYCVLFDFNKYTVVCMAQTCNKMLSSINYT